MDEKDVLLVIDVQNNYFLPNSPYYVLDSQDVLKRINKIIMHFKKNGLKIIYIKHAHRQDGSDIDVFSNSAEDTGFIEGNTGTELCDDLYMDADDSVIKKTRYDAFAKTELEDVLRIEKVENLYLVGFMTGYCISSTARSAHSKDFRVSVIEDCVSGPTLPNIGYGDQDAKKIKNVELTIIACGIGKITTSTEILQQPFK